MRIDGGAQIQDNDIHVLWLAGLQPQKRGLDTLPARRLHAGSMTRGLRRALRFAAFATLLPCANVFGANDPNQGWVEVRSAHFVVSSNAGEKEARRIADQFEQMRALFHGAFANLDRKSVV